MHKGKKRQRPAAVELNLAAMLDMAFQLLTFFMLTFRSAPIEGQINLRLPPPQSVAPTDFAEKVDSETAPVDPLQHLRTLVISLAAIPTDGAIGSMQVGSELVGSLARLDERLRVIFALPASPIDQVLIHVDSNLSYAGLMSAVDVCTRQIITDKNGRPGPLKRLSFVEMSTN